MASRANHLVLLRARCCAPQHCCAPASAIVGAAEEPLGHDRGFGFPGRLRRPAGRRWQADPLHSRPRQENPVSRLSAGRSVSGGRRYSPGQLSASRRRRQRRARADQGVPLRPGDAGRLADRVRSDGPGQNRKFLCARRRQRPAAAAGAGTGRGRPHHLRPVARGRKPARTEARHRRSPPMPPLPRFRAEATAAPKPRAGGSAAAWS